MLSKISFVAAILSVSSAFALNPCELETSAADQQYDLLYRYSMEQVDQLQKDLMAECSLYKQIGRIAAVKNPESIQFYKAMQYVDRGFYESAKGKKIPVSKIYQLKRADANLPLEQKSEVIWNNFLAGYAQLNNEVSRVKNGGELTVEALKAAHVGFYQFSNEIGDFAHEPFPGIFFYEKFPIENPQGKWWTMTKDIEKTKADFENINADAQAWGLLQGSTSALMRIEANGDVYRANSSEHAALIKNWFAFANDGIKVISSGYKNLSDRNYPLMSPMRLAMYSQKVYVSIHPFSEGNGRTSRFIQDLILRLYDLPSGSSGDLMNDDTTMPFAKYYDLALKKTKEMLDKAEVCTKSNVKSYDCQEL